jgi:hypothetical protein
LLCSHLVILLVFCSKSSAKFTALLLIAHFAALNHAHAIGATAHSQAHNAKSHPLGNSDSETISYIAISAAHLVAHAAALARNGSVAVANGTHNLASNAAHHNVPRAAVCAKSDTILVHL